MTADEFRNAPLPANRQPELRIAWACDGEGFVTRVVLLGAAKEGDASFVDVVRKYRQGSRIPREDIVMPKDWPVDADGRGWTVMEKNHLTLAEKAA